MQLLKLLLRRSPSIPPPLPATHQCLALPPLCLLKNRYQSGNERCKTILLFYEFVQDFLITRRLEGKRSSSEDGEAEVLHSLNLQNSFRKRMFRLFPLQVFLFHHRWKTPLNLKTNQPHFLHRQKKKRKRKAQSQLVLYV